MFSLTTPALLLCLCLSVSLAHRGHGNYRGGYHRGQRPDYSDSGERPDFATLLELLRQQMEQNPELQRSQCSEITDNCNVDVVGDFATRMLVNGDINDGEDEDGFVDTADIVADLQDNYDVDGDGCVTQTEWSNRWVEMGFTVALADFRFAGLRNDPDGCVGLSIPAFAAFGESIQLNNALDDFLDNNINQTIAFCEADLSLYSSNCDCAQLPEACRGEFSDYPGCVNFVQNVITDGQHEGCIFEQAQSQPPQFDFNQEDFDLLDLVRVLFQNGS